VSLVVTLDLKRAGGGPGSNSSGKRGKSDKDRSGRTTLSVEINHFLDHR